MATIGRLGHVGLHCHDLERQLAFYRDILGLTVTDGDAEHGVAFLSSRPEEEHHELLLVRGRDVGPEVRVLQQLSFRCDRLEDVTEFHRLLEAHGVELDMVVNHGNALGVYFYDPEGNRCEVYWATGLAAHQPFVLPANLDERPEEIRRAVAESVERFGETGTVGRSAPSG